MDLQQPHAGFVPSGVGGPFIHKNGQIFVRRDGPRSVRFGFRVLPDHCNSLRICHGGWMATFMDMTLPLAARVAAGLEKRFLLTISLSLDFLEPAPEGMWVEAEAELLRQTNTMVFMKGIAVGEGQPLLRASGIFRIGPDCPPMPF